MDIHKGISVSPRIVSRIGAPRARRGAIQNQSRRIVGYGLEESEFVSLAARSK